MGIEVVVEDECGKKIASVEDSGNLLHRILPEHGDLEYKWLNHVDWYGDTTFNRLQLPGVSQELKRIARTKTRPEEKQLIQRINELQARNEIGREAGREKKREHE